MRKDLNFAVVGLGMGMHHCGAIAKASGAQLAAVCDQDMDRLNKAKSKFGVRGYESYKALLKDESIDVISLATESGKHAAMGIEAARAGKHLLVEKPVDISPQRIKKLEDVVRETGVKCGCIFQTRFDNCIRLLKEAIDAGKMGRLIGVHGHLPWFREQSYYEGPHGDWKGTWKLDGGGSLMNQGVHTLDVLVHLAGEIDQVAGFYGVFNHEVEAEDQVVAALKFKNGALGTLLTTTCCIPGGEQRIYMYGTEGSFCREAGVLVSYDMGPEDERKRMMDLFSATPKEAALKSDPMALSSDGHIQIVEDLVRAIVEDGEPAIPLSRAKHAVEVATAIYKSGRTGRVISVDSVRR